MNGGPPGCPISRMTAILRARTRVIWELDQNLDRENSIVTHDAGAPRDQMAPFYTATTPHSYVGWGKNHPSWRVDSADDRR